MSNLDQISSFLNCIGDAVIIVNDASQIVFANHACQQVFGYQETKMQGMQLEQLICPSLKVNHSKLVKSFIHSNSVARSMLSRGGMLCVDAAGHEFNARVSIASVTIDNEQYGVATIQDFTALQQEMDKLEVSSNKDALTGLYNRRYLDKTLEGASRLINRWQQIGVIYLDLNRFKPINDTYGHQVGDQILKQASNRLQDSVRFDDLVFRLGGDEFMLLLNLSESSDCLHDIKVVVDKVAASVAMPIRVSQRELTVGASLGVGVYPLHCDDLQQLIELADQAMYRAKRNQQGIAVVNAAS